MDQSFKDDFNSYVRKETKEYVCYECGTYTLKAVRRKYISPTEAKVTLKCERCEYEKEVSIIKFE